MKDMTMNQVCSYLEKELLKDQPYDTLLDFAEDAQQELYARWSDASAQTKTITVYLQNLYSLLDFTLQPLIKESQEFQSILQIGCLLGIVENFQWHLYQQQQAQWAMARIEKEAQMVKHLPQVVQALESHGSMNHSELSHYLHLKESTLTEAMKKILETEIVYAYSVGKYKLYSLSDTGIRYGKEMRKRSSEYQNVEQLINSFSQYLSEHQESRISILRDLNEKFHFSNAVYPGDTVDIHYSDGKYLYDHKYLIRMISNDRPGEVKAAGELLDQTEEIDIFSKEDISISNFMKLIQENAVLEVAENVG